MKTPFEFKTLLEFADYFHDEATCVAHFTAARFRNGEYCPHCRHPKIYKCANGKRYHCAKCKQDFTIRTKTVFGDSKLPLRKWYMAVYLLSTSGKGISSVQLAKQIGVTQKTGWFMDHRIRKAMRQNKGKLFGTVEADETFIGGKEKNKHLSKRLHRGTGGVGKAAVFGMRERGGKTKAKVVETVKGAELQRIIKDAVSHGAIVYTDSYRGYDGLKGYKHTAINHANGQYVIGRAHTNGIESFWALFKRGYHGIYHLMSKKHLQRYVDEFIFRFNRRPGTLQGVFSDVVSRIVKSSNLPYKKLTA